jgi:hypothetical protein
LKARPLRYFLYCLLALAADAALAAPIGVVQRTAGEAWIYSRAERAKPLAAGAAFDSGVSFATGARGSVVLRFNDGQIVVLASNTTFRVKNFVFSEAQPEKGELLFELVKGGMRSVTGSIGEKNRDGWMLETPTASVGISGTDFFAVIDQGLYARVNTGSVTLANSAGTTTIGAGATAFAASDAALPAVTTAVPDGLFAELQALGPGVSAGAASAPSGAAVAGASSSMTGATIAIIAVVAAVAAAAGGGGGSSSTTHH